MITDVSEEVLAYAASIKKELGAPGHVVVANGKPVNLFDPASKYIAQKRHQLPDGSSKEYYELDIEISAVQQGGIY